jgi:hypothetical protein
MLAVVYQSRGRILLDEATATMSTVVSDQCKVGGTKLLVHKMKTRAQQAPTDCVLKQTFVRPKCAGRGSLKRRTAVRQTALALIISTK